MSISERPALYFNDMYPYSNDHYLYSNGMYLYHNDIYLHCLNMFFCFFNIWPNLKTLLYCTLQYSIRQKSQYYKISKQDYILMINVPHWTVWYCAIWHSSEDVIEFTYLLLLLVTGQLQQSYVKHTCYSPQSWGRIKIGGDFYSKTCN